MSETNTDSKDSIPPGWVPKLYLRGVISNSSALSILYALTYFLDIHLYIGVALGI